MSKQIQLSINTKAKKAIEITDLINKELTALKTTSKLCHLFTKHTTVAIIIIPNHDENILLDIEDYLSKIISNDDDYRHNNYIGDMPGHIRALLLGVEKSIPINCSKLDLGRFQGVFLYEFGLKSSIRKVCMTIL